MVLSLSEHDTTVVSQERYSIRFPWPGMDVDTSGETSPLGRFQEKGGIGASVRDLSWTFHGI